MVTYRVLCLSCESDHVIRHGHDQRGKQRFRCRACGRTFRLAPGSAAYDAAFKAQVLAAYQERCSMRGVCRIFGISRHTLATWLKKSPELAGPADEPAPSAVR